MSKVLKAALAGSVLLMASACNNTPATFSEKSIKAEITDMLHVARYGVERR